MHDDEELAHRAARPSGLRHQEHRRHYRHAPPQLNPQNKASHVFCSKFKTLPILRAERGYLDKS